ncbi:MAG: hypothetical protein KAI24_00530, partial [Planctomycetes bacterium]|nr:hypothetical protein [Planctomycetota bacterium]
STDPELVVDRIVELAAMAPGARPFRSVVGTDFGAEQLNRVALPQHEQMVAQFELGEFVKLAGAPQNA